MQAVPVLTHGFYGLVDRLHGIRSHGSIHNSNHGSNHDNNHLCQRFYYTEHRLFEQSLDVYHPAGGNARDAPAAAAAVVCLVVGSAWLGHSRLIYGPTSWWNSSGPRSVSHVNVNVGGGVVCVCIRHRGSFPKLGEYFLKWNWNGNWIWIWICMAVLAAVVCEAFLRREDNEPEQEHENENENENECRHYYWNPYHCHSRFHLQRMAAICASIVAAFSFSLLLLEKIVTRGGNGSATFEEMQHDVMTALAWCHRHRDQILLLDNANNNNNNNNDNTPSPPFLFGGYSSGGHVAATLLQRPASFWTETHGLPPPERFFAAVLHISPVLATRSIDDFCRDEGVWDLLWKEEKKGRNQYENGHGRGESTQENMWHRKHSSSSTTESSPSSCFSSSLPPPFFSETSHSNATTATTTLSSSSSSSSPSPSSSSSLEEHGSDERSSHNKRMNSSKHQPQLQQHQPLQKLLSPPTWLTDQILRLVFGTTQTNDNHNDNHHHRNHRPPHLPSPLHTYRNTPFLPHIFIGCQRELPFGIPWLDLFFVSRIYSTLLRVKLFPEWDATTVQEQWPDDGTGHGEHRSVVDSRYCEISCSDHWNILRSRELFRVLEREIGRVVRVSARGDSGERERERERTGRSDQ